MRVSAEELDLEPAVYIREGRSQVMLPDLDDFSPECDIEAADVGESGESTQRSDGNAAPHPARGVICDLGVSDAKPVAQRPRSVGPHLAIKVLNWQKKILEATLIEHTESPLASPIMIVLKRNGVDIRIYIDCRVGNSFIQLSNYPIPLINDLITSFEGMIWFMILDMASGFWAVRMTEKAKLISAFTCPFGHFQWVHDQQLPVGIRAPEEEALVDQDVLDYLKLDPQSSSDETDVERSMTPLVEHMTVFKRNVPAPSQMRPVLGSSSYIDDTAHGAATWYQLCCDLDALLYRLRYWNISVCLPKSEFGKRVIPYLSHEIGAEGILATPKIVKGIQELPFPSTLKGVQSFLGSLNYYRKFIEDYAVVSASLNELTDDQVRAERDLSRAKESFETLKRKIVSTHPLRHPDQTKYLVIIPPRSIPGRILNDAELKYHIAEKEVLAVMRVLHVVKNLIEGCPLIIYTRDSVLKWVINSKTSEGRLVPWGVALSQYDLEIRKVCRDEDGLAAIMGASITHREHLDVGKVLIPAMGRVKPSTVVSVEMLSEAYSGVVLSFDGATITSTRKGICGCILWQLPE
ncbi:reverse transcriptase [Phytophthora megakarya]|uniref:Reverse transcriptase n=1 Tax=Phytophthora megakarya TaxID=4795 RepID=A0A225V275_9STRA|nr:reverse transcriptase [Phytophthora megakarya]